MGRLEMRAKRGTKRGGKTLSRTTREISYSLPAHVHLDHEDASPRFFGIANLAANGNGAWARNSPRPSPPIPDGSPDGRFFVSPELSLRNREQSWVTVS